MSPTFDLSTRPWIPARTLGGDTELLGLRDVLLRAHELADLELALPPASAGLWRVLALLTARVTGLHGSDEDAEEAGEHADWEEVREDVFRAGRFDPARVADYFDARSGRFDLFGGEGGRPWLQDPRLAEQCPKTSGVNKLAWGRTAGQNQVWLGGHHTDLDPEPLAPAEAAHHLLATLYYGPSGRCSSRTVGSVAKADTSAGPLRGSVSYHPRGRTLFESLLLNVPHLADDGAAAADPAEDLAPWERDDLPDPLGLPGEGTGLAGRLTGQFRHAVLLVPSADGSRVVDATVTWGVRVSDTWRASRTAPTDPYLVYLVSKEGKPYRQPASADRAVWRDLDSLLSDQAGHHYRPRLFDTWSGRAGVPRDVLNALRLRAFGFDQDGQTRDRQWFTATTPAVVRWLQHRSGDPTGNARALARIRGAVAAAERVGGILEQVLRGAWKASNSPGGGQGGAGETRSGAGPWLRRGTSRYWACAEQVFWRIAYGEDEGGAGTRGFVFTALDAYDEVTSPYCRSPRVAKVVERHRSRLFAGWNPPDQEGRDDA